MSKQKNKKNEGRVSVRIKESTQTRAASMLKKLNEEKMGRKIRFEDLCDLALSLVTESHLAVLQEQSLSHEDRKEILRQKYVALHGPISKDEWTGFTMTKEFHEFLSAQELKPVAA